MDKPIWLWAGFLAIVLLLLVFDVGFLHRKDGQISLKQSLRMSAFYVFISLVFGAGIYWYLGPLQSRDFFTGYLIEKSLSMDNIFVMSLVFAHFYIPRRYQHRVLFFGVLGAVLLRGLMIGIGSVLIQQFDFVMYIFAAFLIFSGVKMLFAEDNGEKDLKDSKLLIWLRSHIKVTTSLYENRFFAYEQDSGMGKAVRKATPLLLALIFIELADIMFAVDSVPAVFAITTDPFIVYSSNIFAILGLRALYFALAAMLSRFEYLKYALSLVLMFIGSKIFFAPYIGMVPSSSSLIVTICCLLGGILFSLYKTKGKPSVEIS